MSSKVGARSRKSGHLNLSYTNEEYGATVAATPNLNGNASVSSPLPVTITSTPITDSSHVVQLRKDVGLISGISLIVGTMIGSGIFVSPKGVAEGSGSVGLSLIVWLLCGIIALLGALSLAELGTAFPTSGGEYAYLLPGVGPLPAYLFAWMSIILLKPASVSIITMTFSEYIMSLVYQDSCGPAPELHRKLLSVAVIFLLTIVNVVSVKLATKIQVVFTVAKLLAVLLIIIGGFVMIARGHTRHLSSGFEGTQQSVGRIAIGFYNGMWAYDGWNNLNYVTEELINPSRNLPLAILIGIPLVIVCYLLVNVSYFTVMSVPELLSSSAVAMTWGERVLGSSSWIVALGVALSTFGAANGSLFAGGRLTYAAGREGHMVELMSMIHVKRSTPLPSLIFTAIVSILLVIPSDIGSLIDLFNFAVWLFYGATMLALIVLRFTQKDLERSFKVPIIIPVIVLLVSVFLVLAPIIDTPKIEFLYALLFILGGLIFYVPFVVFKKTLPGIEIITTFCQRLMEVSPPSDEKLLSG